jgi:CRP-like cAMP-binding protein
MQFSEFFGDFNVDELKHLLSLAKCKRFPAKTLIIAEAKESSSFYILVQGDAETFQTNTAGIEFEIRIIHTGECFGELAVLLGVPRSAGVKAVTDCFVLEIEKEQLSAVEAETRAKIYYQFALILARRLMTFNIT